MRFFPRSSHIPCWLKVHTQTPQCIYFFGPFCNPSEARDYQDSYIADLIQEGAQGIRVTLQRQEPKVLTIAQEFDR